MPYEGMTEKQFMKKIPHGEIQKYEGNCWATTLSMLLRCHNFDYSQKYVTDLFHEWRFQGVTSHEMNELVEYFNKNVLAHHGWIMKTSDEFQGLLPHVSNISPFQVMITGHFLLVLGYNDDSNEITFFDPWDGSFRTVLEGTFLKWNPDETCFMYKE